MNNKELQAETEVQESKNAELLPSAPLVANPLLSDGWISVKDQMPPDVTPVLVFGWCCDICHNIRIAEYEVDGWWESFHGNDLTFIPEYWMPFPGVPSAFR